METSSHAQAVDTQHWNPRLWAILIVLCGALFLDGLDVSMVGVALPDIRTALGLSTSSLQWVVSGYVLGYGGLLLLGGRAADLLGRRRVAGRDGPPGGHHRLQRRLGLAHRRSLARRDISCNYINCTCI